MIHRYTFNIPTPPEIALISKAKYITISEYSQQTAWNPETVGGIPERNVRKWDGSS